MTADFPPDAEARRECRRLSAERFPRPHGERVRALDHSGP